MSGLLRRLTRRRPATADENRSPTAGTSEPAAAPVDAPAEPGGDRPVPAEDQPTQVIPATGEHPAAEQTSPAAEQTSPGAEWAKPSPAAKPADAEQPGPAEAEQPTAFTAQRPPGRDLPAGLDPGDLASAPAASARRGKLRRRLRYLRHVRELLLRDLGGFTYEIHRTAGGTPQEAHRKLSTAKASRIAALDAEVGALEARLGEPHAEPVLREAGIGGTCPECGELHASDAHFCSHCGAPLDAQARARREAAAPSTASHPTPEPQPASVLWAGGPRPSREPAAEEESRPAAVTGAWLAQPTTLDRAARPDAPAEAKADEPPSATDEPAGHEPQATAPVAHEPATTTHEPDEPAGAKADEPAAHEPDAAAPAADEPATTTHEPAAPDASEPEAPAPEAGEPEPPAPEAADPVKPPAKPRRPRAKKKPAEQKPAEPPFEPNGRRDDDVPPPVTSGDPLASQREQGP